MLVAYPVRKKRVLATQCQNTSVAIVGSNGFRGPGLLVSGAD